MHISEDTQVPPDWVSEWKKSRLILCLTQKRFEAHPLLTGTYPQINYDLGGAWNYNKDVFCHAIYL